MTPGAPRLPLLVRAILAIGARLAPRAHRERWRREWTAELLAEWTPAIAVEREATPRTRSLPLARLALGSWRDARALHHLDPAHTPHREGRTMSLIDRLVTTTRHAVRGLLQRPAATGVAVLTLSLGLGATAAIFTLLDRVVFSPLDLPDADRLVALRNDVPCVGEGTRWHLATAQLVYYGAESRTLDRVAITSESGANMLTPDGPVRVRTAVVSVDAMEMLGAEAAHGRLLDADDDRPGAPMVAVLSHGFWERALGADPSIVGRGLPLGDGTVEVVGVLKPGVSLPWNAGTDATDVWMPSQVDPAGPFQNSHVYPAFARLAPGAELAAAQAELDALGTRLPDRFPDTYSRGLVDDCGFRARATPLADDVVGDVDQALWLLFGSVGMLLLLAAANVANLVLVRLEARRGAMAVRMALGAGAADLRRLLGIESALLAGAGAIGGLLIAAWGVPALARLAPEGVPGLDGTLPGPSAVAFTFGVAALVAFGLTGVALTQLRASTLASAVRNDTRTRTSGLGPQRLRRGLVVAQMSLALALVVGAGLLVRTIGALESVDPGFDPEGVLTVDLYPTPNGRWDDVERWTTWRGILDRVRGLPGVEAAGLVTELPLSGGFGCTVQGFPDPGMNERLQARGLTTCAGQTVVAPGVFEALGIPLLEGRTLERSDLDAPERGSVVVSREYAERFWPGQPALGRRVAPSGRSDGPWYTVVGVVGDIPRETIGGEPANAIYYPAVRIPESSGYFPLGFTLVVRTNGVDPLARLAEVRGAVHAVDPTMPLADASALTSAVDRALARVTFTALLLRIAAAVGLLLAAVGLYGVVSYVVARRTREIGTRIALGAEPRGMEWMVLRGTAALVAAGLALGVGLALVGTRWMAGMLFGVRPADPLTLAIAALLLTGVAMAAAWLPARRAARVDPAVALRAE